MGSRGPKPTPTKILANRGSWRAEKRKDVSYSEECDFAHPDYLSDGARAVWDALYDRLKNLGVMTPLDQNAFARYCFFVDLLNKEMADPARSDSRLEKYSNQVSKLEQSFGLTPSARTNIAVGKKEEPDKFIRAV